MNSLSVSCYIWSILIFLNPKISSHVPTNQGVNNIAKRKKYLCGGLDNLYFTSVAISYIWLPNYQKLSLNPMESEQLKEMRQVKLVLVSTKLN